MANHYKTLQIDQNATQAQIKQAYRRLAKLFHPDSQLESANHEQIVQINAAYEVLSDPKQRQSYDRQIQKKPVKPPQSGKPRPCGSEVDAQLNQWLSHVYRPVNRALDQILNGFQTEVDDLSADPFDDELMEAFQTYVENSKNSLDQAQNLFRSWPNPANFAGVAAYLYYSLNHIGDGLEDLKFFSLNYEDSYLHTGQEFFRLAAQLQQEAQAEIGNLF